MSSYQYENRRNFLVSFAYIGEDFVGVQEQPGLTTVLGALRTRIEESAAQKACGLYVSARTDRGVHALGNVATFFVRPTINSDGLIADICRPRSDGLFGVVAYEVAPKVHARGSAQAKHYRYTILDERCDDNHHYAWCVTPRLSVEAMSEAAQFMIGEHDFSSLRGGGCQSGTPIREVMAIDIVRADNDMIFFDIVGRGFLRKMIRNMVGLLVEIGAGLRPASSVASILDEKSRLAAGIMAPPQGLCLVKINLSQVPSS